MICWMASSSPSPTKVPTSAIGQISWYSSVQSSSTFRYRLAHKPLYIFRFKIIEQGQLSYPKICPYYFSCASSNQSSKLHRHSLLYKSTQTRIWLIQRKISESMAPRHLIWLNISHIISMTSIKSHLKVLVTQKKITESMA